jgi:hypothetical protein
VELTPFHSATMAETDTTTQAVATGGTDTGGMENEE